MRWSREPYEVMRVTVLCQKRLEPNGEEPALTAVIMHMAAFYQDLPFCLNWGTWLIFYILSKRGVWLTRNRTEHFKHRSSSAKRKSYPAGDFSFAELKSNEIPWLGETGCPTDALATPAVLIFLNNSLRKCIPSQKTVVTHLSSQESGCCPSKQLLEENLLLWAGKSKA